MWSKPLGEWVTLGVKRVWLKKRSLGFIHGKLESPVEMSKVRQESPHWDWKGAGTRLMARQRGG